MAVVLTMRVQAPVQVVAGALEDASSSRLTLRIGRNGQGVQPGQAPFEEGQHVGGVAGTEQVGPAGDDVDRGGVCGYETR